MNRNTTVWMLVASTQATNRTPRHRIFHKGKTFVFPERQRVRVRFRNFESTLINFSIGSRTPPDPVCSTGDMFAIENLWIG